MTALQTNIDLANSPNLQCRHIFTGGLRCGSRCLRKEYFCYYHHTTRAPKTPAAAAQQLTRRARSEARQSAFTLTRPEDRSAIQHAIGELLARVAGNTLDPRRAGLLLSGLQIATLNLPKPAPIQPSAGHEPEETVAEVVDDPIHGLLAPTAEITDQAR